MFLYQQDGCVGDRFQIARIVSDHVLGINVDWQHYSAAHLRRHDEGFAGDVSEEGRIAGQVPPPINGPRATMRKEKDYYIFRTPESSLEQIKQIQAETGQSQRIRPVYLHRFAVV